MNSTRILSKEQLLTTALFYADSGVYWVFDEIKKDISDLQSGENPVNYQIKPEKNISHKENILVQKAYSIANKACSLHELKSLLCSFHEYNLCSTSISTICAIKQKEGKDLMIIGYTPSDSDNISGEPFSGKTGNMLDKMLKSIDLVRSQTYMSMISPWYPTGNRNLSDIEIEICRPLIIKQIELISPKIIFFIGSKTKNFFFNNNYTNTYQNLGKWHNISVKDRTIPTLSTVHPQELIKYPLIKKNTWHVLIALKKALKKI
ncbi:uracil-DNA glycosylase [Candidatus Liberibacter brunswickensis]